MSPLDVILISGWASDSGVWDALVPALGPAARASCIEWWDCLCAEGPAALIEALCGAEEPVVCIGWSLGGLLAMRGALARPERVRGLVLISSTSRMTADGDCPGVHSRHLRAMQLKLSGSRDAVLRDFWTACLAPVTDAGTIETMCRRAARIPEDSLLAGLRYLEQEDLRRHLHRLTMPALVLHGDQDAIISHACGAYLAGQLPCGNLITVAGHGHALLQFAAGPTAKAIRSFLNGFLT